MLGPSTRPPCGVGNEAWRLFVTQNLPSALQPLCIGSLPWCRAQPYSRLSQLSIRYANGIPPVQALSTCRTTSDELQPTSAASKTTHDTILVFDSLTPLYREPNLPSNSCLSTRASRVTPAHRQDTCTAHLPGRSESPRPPARGGRCHISLNQLGLSWSAAFHHQLTVATGDSVAFHLIMLVPSTTKRG